MASTLRTWIISAAAASGVVGGAAVGLATAAPAQGTPTKPTRPQAPAIDTTALQAQVQQLIAEDRALHVALAQAKARLSSQVAASEASLRAVRSQLTAAEAALAAARRAASTTTAPTSQQPTVVRRQQPTSHTTTGASGASGGSGESGDGGHDD